MSQTELSKALLASLGRVPSGVFVMTLQRASAETGLLVSWVQQCSFTPPLVTVAVKQGREVLDFLTPGSEFTLNVLDEGQTDLVSHFGRGFKPDEPAFVGLAITRLENRAPVLDEALAWLGCRICDRHSAGDHMLLIAEVVVGQVLSEGRPMVHVRKTASHY